MTCSVPWLASAWYGVIGAVELAAGGQLPDRRGYVVFVGAGAEKIQGHLVAGSAPAHEASDLGLGQRLRNAFEGFQLQFAGDLRKQIIDLVDADDLEHGIGVGLGVGYERHALVVHFRQDPFVGIGVEQFFQVHRRGRSQPEQPALAVGIRVDQFR